MTQRAVFFCWLCLCAVPASALDCGAGLKTCGESCIPQAETCPLETDLPAYQGWRERLLPDQRTPLSGVAVPAHTQRMYVWEDPQTGTQYLSGKPPPWYGDPDQAETAPRTRVYEGMYLVDDTRLHGMAAEQARQRQRQAEQDLEKQRATLLQQMREETARLEKREITVGMSQDAVAKVWGTAQSVSVDTALAETVWHYPGNARVYFRQGQVTRIEGAMPSAPANAPGSQEGFTLPPPAAIAPPPDKP